MRQNCRQQTGFALILLFFLHFLAILTLVPVFLFFLSLGYDIPYDQTLQVGDGTPSSLVRWVQTGSQVFTWFLPAFLIAWLLGSPVKELRLPEKVSLQHFAFAVIIVVVSIPFVQLVTFNVETFRLPSFFSDLETGIHEAESRSLELVSQVLLDVRFEVFLANALVFAIVPAICEEVFFRGVLQQRLTRVWNPHLAIWVSAAIFSLVHFQFYGFFSRLVLGAVLGYLFWRTGDLKVSILAHCANNLISLVVVYISLVQGTSPDEIFHPSNGIAWYWGVLSAVLLFGLTYWFIKPKNDAVSPNIISHE
ncbi:MAG: CPBP family intramembrane glutamic endopeptidase [Bacteroidota bacterium]